MRIDPRFQRIARRLSTFELVAGEDTADGSDLRLAPGEPVGRRSDRFLGFYSRDGLRRALEAYGVRRELEALGLGSYDVVVEARDPYQHRVQVLLDGVVDDDHRLIDLVMRPQRVRVPTEVSGVETDEPFSVLVVEWLCLQNPRAVFTRELPRLPGQRWPGLGLAYTMHNLTQLMAQRLDRDGVVNVPEVYHLALVYRRTGYRFTSRRHRLAVEALESATAGVRLAAVAWAVERGLVRAVDAEGDDAEARPWRYEPAEMVAPVSPRLQRLVEQCCAVEDRAEVALPRPRLEVDLEGLRRSLREDPVEGLDPDEVLVGAGGATPPVRTRRLDG